MNLFKPKFRVVKVVFGWLPQVYVNGIWSGIASNLCTWKSPDSQFTFCSVPTEEVAQATLDSYKAIVT